MKKTRTIILGAGGRDFHNFLVCFKNNPAQQVVCFTASQIPGIENRIFPKELSGKLYPKGIKIFPEKELPKLIKKFKADEVILSYSDLSNREVMNIANIVLHSGADFRLIGPEETMLKSRKPVISVGAVRTGAGKSPTTRKICSILKRNGKKAVLVRHPMPYGILSKQICQRFQRPEDLKKHNCTIEEIEEYEPHIREGNTVYAGVDYSKILREAEKEADIIVFDGGNNDTPFFKPDLHIVIADPHRPGHELRYYPGTLNLMLADVVIINKVGTASPKHIKTVEENVKSTNKRAIIIKAKSPLRIDRPELIEGKRVLIVDDGPTITHGGMSEGAGWFAVRNHNTEVIDPRPYAVGSIKEIYRKYPHIGKTLPAMGYGKRQLKELEKTINNAKCDTVVAGTPIVLHRYMKIKKPIARVSYELEEIGKPDLENVLWKFLRKN